MHPCTRWIALALTALAITAALARALPTSNDSPDTPTPHVNAIHDILAANNTAKSRDEVVRAPIERTIQPPRAQANKDADTRTEASNSSFFGEDVTFEPLGFTPETTSMPLMDVDVLRTLLLNSNLRKNPVAVTLARILWRIKSEQYKQSTEYSPKYTYPPLEWHNQKGTFPSYVHLNFNGDFGAVRNLYHFPDDNGFVTSFVLMGLLEVKDFAHRTDLEPLVSQLITADELEMGAEAILTHADKNFEPSTGIYNFWNMIQNSDGSYKSWPANIAVPISEGKTGTQMISTFLAKFSKELAKKVATVSKFFEFFNNVFAIPADADDSSCHVALGGKFSEVAHRLGSGETAINKVAEQFRGAHSQSDMLWAALLKYAYRPFTEDAAASTIDPRTYYWMHNFFVDAKRKYSPAELEKAAFVTTWLQNTDEVAASAKRSSSKMPFNVNNVDASVVANTLYGITFSLYTEPEKFSGLFNADMQNLFLWSGRLLTWILEKDVLATRPDLILLYYPSRFDFYWFVARLYKLLSRPPLHMGGRVPTILVAVREMLFQALNGPATEQILRLAINDPRVGYVWEEFLGERDTILGREAPTHEDRVFSTSAALLALLDIWGSELRQYGIGPVGNGNFDTGNDDDYVHMSYSTYDQKHRPNHLTPNAHYDTFVKRKGRLFFRKSTPAEVKDVMRSAFNFLLTKADKFKRENAFFSASVKGGDNNPFYYPTNTLYDMNTGAPKTCDDPVTLEVFALIAGVKGVMSDVEFQQKLKSSCFGKPVPTQFDGLANAIFPYWSSPALTDAIRAAAVVKGEVIGLRKMSP